MPRDRSSGAALVAGALAMTLALAHHPTARQMLAADAEAAASLNVRVHALALFAMPLVVFGLVGVCRRLGWSQLTRAALVAYGFAAAALTSAAVASGFVSTHIVDRLRTAEGDAVALHETLLAYTHWWNQAFSGIGLVASSIAVLLASVAILRTRRLPRPAGAFGLAVAAGALAAYFSGHLGLDVHGFGLLTFAQSGWLVWVGVAMSWGRDSSKEPDNIPS